MRWTDLKTRAPLLLCCCSLLAACSNDENASQHKEPDLTSVVRAAAKIDDHFDASQTQPVHGRRILMRKRLVNDTWVVCAMIDQTSGPILLLFDRELKPLHYERDIAWAREGAISPMVVDCEKGRQRIVFAKPTSDQTGRLDLFVLTPGGAKRKIGGFLQGYVKDGVAYGLYPVVIRFADGNTKIAIVAYANDKRTRKITKEFSLRCNPPVNEQ